MKVNLAVCVYLGAIILANLTLLWFGPSAPIVNAFLLIGLDLSLRDRLHEAWSGKALWAKMLVLVASGSLVTVALNLDAWQIALASAVAFGVAGFGDAVVYHWLRHKPYLWKANGSNVTGSFLDSIIFPTLAFGLWMPELVLGQFLAKVAGGYCWALWFNRNDPFSRHAHLWRRDDC